MNQLPIHQSDSQAQVRDADVAFQKKKKQKSNNNNFLAISQSRFFCHAQLC